MIGYGNMAVILIMLFLHSSCGHNDVDMEKIQVVSDEAMVDLSEPRESVSRTESYMGTDSPVLTKSFHFESEEVRSVDLTVPSVSDIFLSGLDSEIKSGGPAVFFQPSLDSDKDQALTGQLVVPVEDRVLQLSHVTAEKMPEWISRCEIMVMYHLECTEGGGKSIGFLTESSDMVAGHAGKGIVINYICPGIYQAAYNCGSEKMGQGKSVKVTLSPAELKEQANNAPDEGTLTAIDMAEIQDSEVKDSEELLSAVYDRIKIATKMWENPEGDPKQREDLLADLEELAVKTKEELAKSDEQIADLREKIRSLEENEGMSEEDAKAQKKLLTAKIKHLRKKSKSLKQEVKQQKKQAKNIEQEKKDIEREQKKEEKLKKKMERQEKKKDKKMARSEKKEKKNREKKKSRSES